MHHESTKGRSRKSQLRLRFDSYLVNEAPKHVWLALWIIAQITYFVQSYIQLVNSPVTASFFTVLSHGLPIARSSANLINFNCAIILFTVCRSCISKLRVTFINRYIPFDKSKTFHICLGWAIVFWSFIHCAAHFYNFYAVELALGAKTITSIQLNLLSGPGATGQVITICLFLMVTSAMEAVRRKNFELFWFSHHLFIVFFGGMLMHGSFCLIKGDIGDVCRGGPTFWKFWLASGVLYLLERVWCEIIGGRDTYISKVIQHPSNVVEVQIIKPRCVSKAGQYVYLTCPEIAGFERHPFTLTSSPNEEFISVHIRVVGDWTKAFGLRLGCRFGRQDQGSVPDVPKSLPLIKIDGPYGSAAEDVFNYEVAVLVGAGIGVTPFASILKTIWYRFKMADSLNKLKKVYFIWICRDKEAFEWFQDLLLTIEEENMQGFLEIRTYLTGKLNSNEIKNVVINNDESTDAITGLRSQTLFGRPNWNSIFQDFVFDHRGTDVGVFFCGPKAVSMSLHQACNKFTDAGKDGTRFFYGKENF
ncbi:hypothetical protein BCR33DRAFT_657410 [Rhizoclosmatium globosum]|uniref:FAD-binding FR-type domain-containing protein n=1 Tax=Rhizoclosmatium globosum TaxID=329046 RepID=A0A1Y2CPV7_9FUNG|nr:hypothetical protein BCR33DRAFT_657410 [Rhizoclosmatium globosum]|eukprot:ORY49052.1 hypothetical protein BCR33DRAFT_657410 [Rhizoclosmatium globosum]